MMRSVLFALALLGALGGCAFGTGPDLEVGTEVAEFGSNPAGLTMYEYLPANLPPDPAMVVPLHHCFQFADDYIEEAGWKPLADRYKFILLMPQQNPFNDLNRCFGWFSGGDMRGKREVESIRQMVERMIALHGIDPRRIFVTGLSSGGSMTLKMLAAYPEFFGGGGAIGSVTFGCTSFILGALHCQTVGESHTPQEWGDMVRKASPHQGPWPLVSIWHGDQDAISTVRNARDSVTQWTNVHGTDATPDRTETLPQGYLHYTYDDAASQPVVEYWRLVDYGHSVPVDWANGCGNGRDGVGDFVSDVGLCSSFHMLKFWGVVPETEILTKLTPG